MPRGELCARDAGHARVRAEAEDDEERVRRRGEEVGAGDEQGDPGPDGAAEQPAGEGAEGEPGVQREGVAEELPSIRLRDLAVKGGRTLRPMVLMAARYCVFGRVADGGNTGVVVILDEWINR